MCTFCLGNEGFVACEQCEMVVDYCMRSVLLLDASSKLLLLCLSLMWLFRVTVYGCHRFGLTKLEYRLMRWPAVLRPGTAGSHLSWTYLGFNRGNTERWRRIEKSGLGPKNVVCVRPEIGAFWAWAFDTVSQAWPCNISAPPPC
jgi:hypothetical protein